MATLALLGVTAIVFTVTVIQIQAGATAYLAGLSAWTRAQVEAVRHTNIYARTGDPQAFAQANRYYQVPVGDMVARLALEATPIDLDTARQGLLAGGNHPDDVDKMIRMFRLLKNAPYFRDAVDAWRQSDAPVIQLGVMQRKLRRAWQQEQVDMAVVSALHADLEQVNDQLATQAFRFRQKMSLASRALVTILSVASIVFFVVLGALASYIIYRMTAVIRNSEHKYRTTFEQAAMGIAQLNSEGCIVEANSALCTTLGYTREQLLMIPYRDLIFPEDRQVDLSQRKAVAEGTQDSVCFQLRLCCKNGSEIWAKITMSKFSNEESDTNRFICIVEDVSEQYRLSQELTYQARHDNLTGLLNRRTFEAYLKESLINARNENYVHCLCFIDLDQFKIINDTLGHFAGDQLLVQVTQQLAKSLRKRDLLARLGGDEFGLILDCCEPDAAVKIAEQLRHDLKELPFVWEGRSFTIGCSIGIVPILATSSDEADLLQAADSACHLAKEQGRNRVLLTYQGDEELTARKVQMEWLERINLAIKGDQLVLYAQQLVPQTDALGMRIEVLVRMRTEGGDLIPPGAFLPAAERFGVAHFIDRWVIEEVCRKFSESPAFMGSIDACHINISGTSFGEKDFTKFTLKTLNQYAIPAKKICFEITETAAISNLKLVHDYMGCLREQGSSFALDDFGAGLSSFAYLKQLPVEYLKIDGSFVKNMATDDADCAMVRAISDIGRALGKIMVAEFVEDQKSLDLLSEMGVEYAQGYHTHRPEPLVDVMSISNNERISSDTNG
ncbi:putative bifunctional diguanylate cyclase/phosphodiesterase [Simiduia aestuariiviva]|uniref:Diguanylate cyclase (GGDEF)-like protein/PAS domain S-box-containing protein n=1 Tax=Simiduia aestuariiviva TaxID=1510459 RepID=A0A839UT84_9GAMM|nr:EAL domain-containing protein [Simiduia aestuariiviva]MBB3169931.1 diguanylate cyclase (GGDEF)-like protein/PAS domain S-box-containing protein [Simiduia aestuariiviva]